MNFEVQQQPSRTATLGMAISLVALLSWIVAGAMEDAGVLWPAVGVLGLAGAAVGGRALSRREGRPAFAIAALVIGGLLFTVVAVFTIAFLLDAGWAD